MKINPIIIEAHEELEDIFFDVTLIVDKDNNLVVVDNSKSDWHDFVDTNTLTTKKVKIDIN